MSIVDPETAEELIDQASELDDDDGGTVVSLDDDDLDDDDEQPRLFVDEDSPNLVKDWQGAPGGTEKLRALKESILDYFKAAWESGEAHRKKEAKNWMLFTGDLPKKDYPWENCANVHIPLALENISRLAFRTHGEIFGDGRDVFTVEPIGPDDVEIAEIIGTHDNWQLMEQIPDFTRQMFRANLRFFYQGSAVCHSFYDPEIKQNRHESLGPDEFVVPYTHVSVRPDFGDCPYYFRIRRMYRNQLQSQGMNWVGVEEVLEGLPPDHSEEPDKPLEEAVARQTRVEAPPIEQEYSGTYTILQFEGWLPLEKGKRDRWCQAYVDHTTERLLTLTIHEEPSWEERARYEEQKAALDAYAMELTSYETQLDQATVAAQKAFAGQLPMPQADAVGMQVASMAPPPEPPGWAEQEDGELVPPRMERVPIRTFSHAVCIENLTGIFGLSYGAMLSDMNRAANTTYNMFLDAASLANNWAILLAGGVSLDRSTGISPGAQIQVVGAMSGDLQKAIMPIKADPANPQLKDATEFMMQTAQASVQAPSVLSGEPGKSGETYRGLSARLEQAQKQLSVAAQNLCTQLYARVFQNNARLNSIFLPESSVKFLMNHKSGEPEFQKINRAYWARLYSVRFRADLRFSTTAMKISEADEILQMVQFIRQQLGAAGPVADLTALVWDAASATLKARNRPDLVASLGPRPKYPVTPLGIPTGGQGGPGVPPGAEQGQQQSPGSPGGPQGG